MKSFLKYIASCVMQFLMRIMWLVPIKNNRIVFISYDGSQYACNPKYISEYLVKKYPGKFEIVWMLHYPEQYKFLKNEGVNVVDYGALKKFRYGLTAKVIVVNTGLLYSWVPVRKNQLHINTWHGGGFYKLSGLDEARTKNFEKRRFVLASKNTSYFLSTNRCFTDVEIRPAFGYEGDVLNIGFPRNDIFFHGDYTEIHKKVCRYFGVNEDCRILLYAPTSRYADTVKFMIPDFKKLKRVASERFGGEWVVFTRMHHHFGLDVDVQDTYDANYRPDMPDMQELLVASDMLISDYSSCIWDFSFTYRPCVLYTPDLDEYTANRGFGIDINEWGFPICKTEQELWKTIKSFDEEDFRKAMEIHHNRLGSFETGNATETIGELIYDFCFSKQDSNS